VFTGEGLDRFGHLGEQRRRSMPDVGKKKRGKWGSRRAAVQKEKQLEAYAIWRKRQVLLLNKKGTILNAYMGGLTGRESDGN